MTNKWDAFKGSLERLHTDMSFPTATFYGYTTTYNNSTDTHTTSESSIGTSDVEFVPPGADSTIDDDGRSVDFNTSIRLPSSDSVLSASGFRSYREDSEKASTVEIEGQKYIVQSVVPEEGSGFSLIRLVEE